MPTGFTSLTPLVPIIYTETSPVDQLFLQYLFLVTFQLQKLQTTTFLTVRWPCAMLRYVLLH